MTDHIGQQLGNYRLIQYVGGGGFADVYLGEHIHLNTWAAIKVLHTRLSGTGLEQFREEARIVARLAHPGIVRVFDFGVDEATPFLVMEYAPKGSLRKWHSKGTRLPIQVVISYVKQIANSLQYAHEQKIIHRDIKPENMLVNQRNEVVLSDFGLALYAHSSQSQNIEEVGGTAKYMAPEQIHGKPRPASDQYALGIVVYEWLCGECPFQGQTLELWGQHMFAPVPPLREKMPTIPPMVEEVLFTALSKDPKQRFGNMHAFALALEQASREKWPQPLTFPAVPIHVQPLPLSYPVSESTKWEQREQATMPISPVLFSTQTIDMHEATDLFHQFMRSDSRIRVFCLTGDAKMGKSHLLTKIFPDRAQLQYQARHAIIDLRNKMHTIPDILRMICCQVGLKNCDSYFSTQQTFNQDPKFKLGMKHVLNIFSIINSVTKYEDIRRRDLQLMTQLVNDLSQLDDKPLLLLFDSVNNADESIQTWFMDTFLVHLSLLSHVRVVVAGRTLPESHGSYTAFCRSYRLQPVAEEAEYISYCKRLNVELTEQSIRDFAYACDYNPGMFVDYVLPKFARRRMSHV